VKDCLRSLYADNREPWKTMSPAKESILSVRKFCRLTIEIEYVEYGYLAFSHCFKTLRIAPEGTFASHGALEKLFQVMV
jgi:hypothetical protein